MAEASAPALALIGFILLQRLAELAYARRNEGRLRARGAREVGAEHYPLIVALHAGWLASLALFGWSQPASPGWLAAFVGLQLFRLWTLASLGERWTTRVLVLDAPLVTRGPYRFMRHPNYALVVAEIAVAPLALGLERVALAFSLLNAALLAWRIRVEDRALRR
jgi:methyltransferase